MKRALIITLALVFTLAGATVAFAKPEYVSKLPADKASQSCNACHTSIPALNDAGKAFKANNLTWPAAKAAPAKAAAPAAKPAAPAAKAEPAKAAAPAAKPVPVAKPAAMASIKVKVDMLGKATEVSAVKDGDKVLVPARAVAEALGAKVTGWDNQAKKATVNYAGKNYVYAAKVVKGAGLVDAAALAGDLNAGFDAKALAIAKGKKAFASEQWATTLHNVANQGEITPDKNINRDTCMQCHDGQGFANAVTKRADLPEAVRNIPNSIDCTSCHSPRGKEIIKSGATPVLANGFKVAGAGAGALCITCHNGRKLPDPEKMPAPHLSAQSDVVFATVGARVPGASYPSSPHGANPNTCLSCHMGPNQGVKNHTFKVIDTPEYVAATCGSCHAGLKTVNRLALADYDGDKVIEGIQDEVAGLEAILEGAIKAKEAELGVEGHYSHGSFYWQNQAGEKVKVPVELYNAKFNLTLIEDDGSGGVHNPAYTVSLLQQSYRALTSKPVANAVLR